jgi:hypothetical protein
MNALDFDRIQDPKTPITGAGRVLVTLDDDAMAAAMLQAIGRKLAVVVEYPTDLYIPRRERFIGQVFDIVCPKPSLADKVDFSDEIAAIERLQADLGARFTISGGEIIELGKQEGSEQIPF